jgi:transposase
MIHVGWDWAAYSHDVTVMDQTGGTVDRWSLTHTEEAIGDTIRRLARYGPRETIEVAIETSNGLIVDRLLAAGHPVVPIHPNSFNAARPRWGASRAKSDPGDSWRLADYLRTDRHRLVKLHPPDQVSRKLQVLSRTRDDHIKAKLAAVNQLSALLDAHWPGPKTLFTRLDRLITLDFLERYPTPESALRIGQARMAAFLKRHSYSGRKTPADLITRLKTAPKGASQLDPETLTETIHAQIRLIRLLVSTIDDLDRALTATMTEHPKHHLLAPLPRIGETNLAQILAEVGPILDKATTLDQACAEIGATPVTRASGQQHQVAYRWTVNTKARKALATFADNSRHHSPWAAELYRQARQRGKRHPHAIRILMRAWLRVIWACWQTNTPYHPHHHGAEQKLAKQKVA